MRPADIQYWFCLGVLFVLALKMGQDDVSREIQAEYLAATASARDRT